MFFRRIFWFIESFRKKRGIFIIRSSIKYGKRYVFIEIRVNKIDYIFNSYSREDINFDYFMKDDI